MIDVRYEGASIVERCARVIIIHDDILAQLAMFTTLQRLAQSKDGDVQEFVPDKRIVIRVMGATIEYEKLQDRWGALTVCVLSISRGLKELKILEKVLRTYEATLLDAGWHP